MRRNWTASWNKVEEEGRCRVCGQGHLLDPAHIIPRSRGGDMAAENIVPLCRHHHSEFDAGRLEILGALTREEQVHAVELVGLGEAYVRLTTLDGEPWQP